MQRFDPLRGRENDVTGNLLFHGFEFDKLTQNPRLLKGLTPFQGSETGSTRIYRNDYIRIMILKGSNL